MKQLILCLAGTAILLAGCSEETIKQEIPEPGKHEIELIAFGMSNNPTDQNKGFGLAYYCYIDLKSDSVFIQKRVGSFESSQDSAWVGMVSGLSQNKVLRSFIEASQQTKNGNIVATLPNGKFFYDGYHYYSSYKKGNSDKFHFYTTSELETKFEEGVDYIMALYLKEKLKPVNSFVNADSMVIQLVNKPEFSVGRLPAPPPIRATVNYTPPTVNKP
jgi:hypothetical protein